MAAGTKQLTKNGAKTAARGNFLQRAKSWPGRLSAYYEEIKREMRLVTWPSRAQVRSTTIVVLVTVFAFGVYFGIVDYILAFGSQRLYALFTP